MKTWVKYGAAIMGLLIVSALIISFGMKKEESGQITQQTDHRTAKCPKEWAVSLPGSSSCCSPRDTPPDSTHTR